MHGPSLTGTKRRTRRTGSSTCHRRTALKNRLAGNWTPRNWTRSAGDGNSGLHRRRSRPQRSLVHRTWSGLWNDHARRWRWRSEQGGPQSEAPKAHSPNHRRRSRERSLGRCRRHHRTCRHTGWRWAKMEPVSMPQEARPLVFSTGGATTGRGGTTGAIGGAARLAQREMRLWDG